jgi:two-component system chemotaxis response regulator CheB
VKLVSRIKVITHVRARLARSMASSAPAAPHALAGATSSAPSVIAIGASTGGPAAVVEVLRALAPAPSPLPILLVMHIGKMFAPALADWLDAQTPHRVSFAVDGARLETLAGRVLMAPADKHLVVHGGRLRLTDGPERHSCRPSVDELFESLAAEMGARTVACLLTGMGRDGAVGMLAIKTAGGFTIAQDEATSVVYGMPREAALLGGASRILPLGEIGRELGAASTRGEGP